ncbi:MAG: hypothetical protein AAF849_02400 [Bacteroidota bacterium]
MNLEGVFNFYWDSLIIVSGPRFPQEVKKIIGINDNSELIPDNSRAYYFLKNSTVAKVLSNNCLDVDFVQASNGRGYVKYSINSQIVYKKTLVSGRDYISVIDRVKVRKSQ